MPVKTVFYVLALFTIYTRCAFAQVPAGPTAPAPPPQPAAPNNTVSQPAPVPQLEKSYENRLYGFAVKYPSAWNIRDFETGKGKQKAENFWVAFGSDPMTVNIHSQKLAPTTNAEVFAKHNSYVNNWTRRVICGSPAFYTQSGTPESKNVIHRAIVILKGRAIMMNCVDKSGGPIATSGMLFEGMLKSLQPLPTEPQKRTDPRQKIKGGGIKIRRL